MRSACFARLGQASRKGQRVQTSDIGSGPPYDTARHAMMSAEWTGSNLAHRKLIYLEIISTLRINHRKPRHPAAATSFADHAGPDRHGTEGSDPDQIQSERSEPSRLCLTEQFGFWYWYIDRIFYPSRHAKSYRRKLGHPDLPDKKRRHDALDGRGAYWSDVDKTCFGKWRGDQSSSIWKSRSNTCESSASSEPTWDRKSVASLRRITPSSSTRR